MKRAFDIIFSAAGLVLLSPIFILVMFLVKYMSKGSVFFTQERIGRNFVPFNIYKFRTMTEDSSDAGLQITVADDPRITCLGKCLRKTKIDELPQLFNVLKGDMSIVGPRPEVAKYVNQYKDDYTRILKVRPGITDLASLTFSNEEELLKSKEDPEQYYEKFLLPEKLKLGREYVRKSSLLYDLMLIFLTFLKIAYPAERINKTIDSLDSIRRPVVIFIEVSIFIICNYAAFYIRWDGGIPTEAMMLFWEFLPLFIAVRIILLFAFKIDRGLWRYVSTKDVVKIFAAVSLGSIVILFTIRYFFDSVSYPRSVYIMDWSFNILLLFGIRYVKQFHEKIHSGKSIGKKKVIVVGAGDAADMLIRDLDNHPYYPYKVIGFIDDNPLKKMTRIRDIPVLGAITEIERIVKREEPEEFLIAIPTLTVHEREELIITLRKFGLPIKSVPTMLGMLTGRDAISSIKVVEPEDVLFREPTEDGDLDLSGYFHSKTVMITGAGGSIGSELSMQIASFKPEKLILFERHEESLYNIDMELSSLSGDGEAAHIPIIGDVTDRERVLEVMTKYRPLIVFHTAAYKHVPMMELNPTEAFKTNVLGTKTITEVSDELDIEKLILVSTDKAVNPVNVMGMTKKVAENIFRNFADRGSSSTGFITVRFGNVLGSSGSVVPLFNAQIKKGGPVTVTHPEIVRYFMTIPEAVKLVLQASFMGEGGEVFVLDMGEPTTILDLAKRMIGLYGFTPGEDIEIKFTGLRPGEKLFEELFNHSEVIEKTLHPKINKAVLKAATTRNVVSMLNAEDSVKLYRNSAKLESFLDQLNTEKPTVVPSK